MSEAPCSMPCPTMECTSLMTGASSADSRRSPTSSSSPASSGSSRWTSSSWFRRPMSAMTSSRAVAAGRTSKPVMSEMSSIGQDVARVAHGHEDGAVVDEPDGDRLVAARGRGGQQVGGRHVDGEGGEVDVVDPEAVGDDPRELVGGQHAVLDEDLAGAAAGLAGLRDGVLDPGAVGEAEVDDDVADDAVGSGAGGRRRHAARRRDGDDCRGHAPDIGRSGPGLKGCGLRARRAPG